MSCLLSSIFKSTTKTQIVVFIWICLINYMALDLTIGDNNIRDINNHRSYVNCLSCFDYNCTTQKKCYSRNNKPPNCYTVFEINVVTKVYTASQAGCYETNMDCTSECGTSVPVVKTGPSFNIRIEKHLFRQFCCCNTNECNNNLTTMDHMPNYPNFFNRNSSSEPVLKSNKASSTLWLSVNTGWIIVIFIILVIAGIIAYKYIKQKPVQTRNIQLDCPETQITLDDKQPLVEQAPPENSNPIPIENSGESDCYLLNKYVRVATFYTEHKFGEFWIGNLQDKKCNELRHVIIKFFLPDYARYWKNELNIITVFPLDHPNITKCYGEGALDSGELQSEMNIPLLFQATFNTSYMKNNLHNHHTILEYYPHGSLYLHLSNETHTFSELYKMAYSIINGLEYLHSCSPRKKPHILHKDLCPINIMLKPNGECCITDFTLSVAFFTDHTLTNLKIQQEGTRHYMAPEVIQGSIILKHDILLMIDIYAYALILYDLVSRCSDLDDYNKTYMTPYARDLGSLPPMYLLKEHVVTNNCRPEIPQSWKDNNVLGAILNIAQECWNEDPEARLSAAAIKHKLSQLKTEEKK